MTTCQDGVLARRDAARGRGQRIIVIASLLSAMALAFITTGAWGFPTFITGYAHVSDTFTGGAGQDTETDVSALNNSTLFGTAAFGGGTATYNLQPAAGAGSISGHSATLSFVNDWLIRHRESQADAYMQLSDKFTLIGVEAGKEITVRVNWTGELVPNTDFESQYLQTFGTTTVTARATLDLVWGFLDPGTGGFDPFVKHQQVSHASNQGVGEFETSIEQAFRNGSSVPIDLGYILTIGAVGSRGGGFSFLGTSGGSSGASSSLAALSEADLLDPSFFEIVVELPPGASISGGSGYVHAVTVPQVPEPASLWLLSVGSLALVCLQCRRRHRAPRL